MGKRMMMRIALAAVLAAVCSGLSFGQVRGHVAGNMVTGFQQTTPIEPGVTTFTTANQPAYWGFEAELVTGHLGFGGDYAVNFEQAASTDWWFDFYSQAVYLSYHLLARRGLFDPYVSVGLGAAGRVALGPSDYPVQDSIILLSIFPVLSGGIAVDLDGLYLGAKVSYLPVVSPPPATSISGVPISRVQMTLSVGLAVGRSGRSPAVWFR